MKRYLKTLVYIALISFGMASSFNSAMASELISTNEYSEYSASNETTQFLKEKLSEEALQEALVANGISPEKAQERLSRLTPEEAQLLAAKIDELPAAGSEITVLLLVIIIVLLLGLN